MPTAVPAIELNIYRPFSPLLKDKNGKKRFEVLPLNSEEEFFSSKNYFVTAIVISTVGAAIFSFYFPAAVALLGIGSWYLWSAAIVVINRAAENTGLEKTIHRLYALSMEIHAKVAAIGVFPLTLFSSYHGPQGNFNGRPILLVNGYLGYGSTWHYHRQKLAKAGLGPIYTMNVGSGQSIKTYAKHVERRIAQIQKETGRNDLALIGHSKGGLVSSYYAVHLAAKTKTKVTDVITIGSPLAGTSWADWALGSDASEMRTGSPFHRELRKEIEQHPKIRFSHIASLADEVVPLSSALLGKDPERHFVLEDLGHLSLIFSSRVTNQICHWLAK